ncbi:hypothetical protein E9993_13680 [Labilibacter sediminis]|nr:hypothetical protein E9993_13680 [Labilibacter sediminis]
MDKYLKLDKKKLPIRENEDLVTLLKEKEYECTLMQQYLSNIGKAIDDHILQELSELSAFVINLPDKIITRKVEGEQEELPTLVLNIEALKTQYSNALIIHNKLSKKTSPANAISIKFTEYSRGVFLKRNKVVNLIMILTFVCLIVYIVLKSIDSCFDENNLYIAMVVVSASGLGAGFYTLSTVRRYIVDRTFDPRYGPSYFIRFFLGIAAGTILYYTLEKELTDLNYGADLLAVIGGFSADAVSVILTRISEVLIGSVKGIKASSNEETELVKHKTENAKQKERLNSIKELIEIKKKAIGKGASNELIEQIDKSINKIDNN